MLPCGRANEKAVAVGHNILTACAVIDGDDAPGRLLKQAVDRGGGAVVKAGGLQLDHAPRHQLQRRLLILITQRIGGGIHRLSPLCILNVVAEAA